MVGSGPEGLALYSYLFTPKVESGGVCPLVIARSSHLSKGKMKKVNPFPPRQHPDLLLAKFPITIRTGGHRGGWGLPLARRLFFFLRLRPVVVSFPFAESMVLKVAYGEGAYGGRSTS